jgi:DNA-binding transcriptional MocR family regulator
MLILKLDRRKSRSLGRQMLEQIIDLIERGLLPPGYQMPSTRKLAERTGVNRTTVVRVYEELWALGYVESTPGSYTLVRRRKEIVSAGDQPAIGKPGNTGGAPVPVKKTLLDSGETPPQSGRGIQPRSGQETMDMELIHMDRLEPDPRLIDRQLFAASARRAVHDPADDMFGYCHPRGYPPLRRTLVRHMQLHGIHASDENILITSGSQNSLQLICQAYGSPGKAVVVEAPTYSMAIPLLRQMGLKVLEVPMEKDGMDLEALRIAMATQPVSLVYSMPTFHNPTGTTMGQARREALLDLCDRHGALLIEDSIEEEMKFFGKVHLPVKSMDDKECVLYLGSFSKVLAPGFRTAWIIAGKQHIVRLAGIKTAFELSSNTVSQVILQHFCSSGGYELHIRKMMRVFRKRMKTALLALKRHIPPDKATWDEPLGGFLVWLQIKPEISDLESRLETHGVRVAHGNIFFFTPPPKQYIRISISKCNEQEIEEGIRRLGQALA